MNQYIVLVRFFSEFIDNIVPSCLGRRRISEEEKKGQRPFILERKTPCQFGISRFGIFDVFSNGEEKFRKIRWKTTVRTCGTQCSLRENLQRSRKRRSISRVSAKCSLLAKLKSVVLLCNQLLGKRQLSLSLSHARPCSLYYYSRCSSKQLLDVTTGHTK